MSVACLCGGVSFSLLSGLRTVSDEPSGYIPDPCFLISSYPVASFPFAAFAAAAKQMSNTRANATPLSPPLPTYVCSSVQM